MSLSPTTAEGRCEISAYVVGCLWHEAQQLGPLEAELPRVGVSMSRDGEVVFFTEGLVDGVHHRLETRMMYRDYPATATINAVIRSNTTEFKRRYPSGGKGGAS